MKVQTELDLYMKLQKKGFTKISVEECAELLRRANRIKKALQENYLGLTDTPSQRAYRADRDYFKLLHIERKIPCSDEKTLLNF